MHPTHRVVIAKTSESDSKKIKKPAFQVHCQIWSELIQIN